MHMLSILLINDLSKVMFSTIVYSTPSAQFFKMFSCNLDFRTLSSSTAVNKLSLVCSRKLFNPETVSSDAKSVLFPFFKIRSNEQLRIKEGGGG